MDLKDKSVVELKALVYDEIGKKEVASNNIQVINQEIGKRMAEKPKVAPASK